MNTKAICTLALACLLGHSCQREVVEAETPTLQVAHSDSKVMIPADGTEVSLAVSSNRADWSAIAQDAWLEVSKGDKQLILKAQSNTSMATRRTSVQVLAGGLSRRVEVEQQSGTASVNLGLTPRAVDQWGGELRIDIDSNGDTWVATTDAEWLKLERDTREQQLIVLVSEHTERRKRTATIVVRPSEGAEPKTIEVQQEGIRYWLLPILSKGQTIDLVEGQEVARRHTLVGKPSSSWAFEKVYKFATISPAFPRLDYVFNRTGEYLFCKAMLQSPAILEGAEHTEFAEYLVARKFEDKGHHVYWNEELRTEAEVILEAAEPFVRYTYYPVDPNNNPTTDHFPLASVTLGSSTPEEIEAYQLSLGGVADEKLSSASRKVYRHTKAGLPKPFVYDYKFTAGKLSLLTYADGNIGRYIYLGSSLVYLNAAFREMLHREGFKYHARDAYATYLKETYRNAEKRIDMVVEVQRTDPYGSGGVAVVISFKAY